mmetsp:Transcript_25145/g.24081  ORF Transcript_25145/g.24081 Transcript_25145/m.24081 type:complete len:547 (-) Transcript_25145:2935-4575(-)
MTSTAYFLKYSTESRIDLDLAENIDAVIVYIDQKARMSFSELDKATRYKRYPNNSDFITWNLDSVMLENNAEKDLIAVNKEDQVANVVQVSFSKCKRCVIWLTLKYDDHQMRIATGKNNDVEVSASSLHSSRSFLNISATSLQSSEILVNTKASFFSDSQRALHGSKKIKSLSNIKKSDDHNTSKDNPRVINVDSSQSSIIQNPHPHYPPEESTTVNDSRHSGVNVLDPLGTNPSEENHERNRSVRYPPSTSRSRDSITTAVPSITKRSLSQSKEEEGRQQSILKRLQISEEWVSRETEQEFTIPLARRENNINSVGIYEQPSGAVNDIAPALFMSNGNEIGTDLIIEEDTVYWKEDDAPFMDGLIEEEVLYKTTESNVNWLKQNGSGKVRIGLEFQADGRKMDQIQYCLGTDNCLWTTETNCSSSSVNSFLDELKKIQLMNMETGAYLWDISKINYQRNNKPKFVCIIANMNDMKDSRIGYNEIKVFDGEKVTENLKKFVYNLLLSKEITYFLYLSLANFFYCVFYCTVCPKLLFNLIFTKFRLC